MNVLTDAWISEWQSYEVNPVLLGVIGAAVLFALYRERMKTLLGLWGLVYGWSMYVIVVLGAVDLEEGFNILWVCGWGLGGFFVLGTLVYKNLGA